MSSEPFDPRPYLMKVSGADYLQVRDRIRWLRAEHPAADITTDAHLITDKLAIFRAIVVLPGGGSASGWGSETAQDFPDFIMKAETKSLGRALAALGFGTQFCADFDTGVTQDGRARIVDSPVTVPALRPVNGSSTTHNDSAPREASSSGSGNNATPKQIGFILAIGGRIGMSEGDVDLECKHAYKVSLRDISRAHASDLIDRLTARQAEGVDTETGEITSAAGEDDGAGVRELINFRERYSMASTKDEFTSLFAEAGDREPYWLAMISATTVLKRLERLAEVAAEQSAWTGPVSAAYAAHHATLVSRETLGR